MNSNGELIKTKFVDKVYNFVVRDFSIQSYLLFQNFVSSSYILKFKFYELFEPSYHPKQSYLLYLNMRNPLAEFSVIS